MNTSIRGFHPALSCFKWMVYLTITHKQTHDNKNSEKTIWFKFSEDDTLVTTIDDLEKDLSSTNRDFTIERIKEALNFDQELFINYS